VGVGLGVVREMMELEVDEVVGPKGRHDPDRVGKCHGHEAGSMTLGGRPVRSLREGLDETLTLMRLEITGQLAKTLCSPIPASP
jgi:hypothetical protein